MLWAKNAEACETLWREFSEAFLYHLYPTRCVACENWRGDVRNHLCRNCRYNLVDVCPVRAPSCDGCGDRVDDGTEQWCAACLVHRPPYASLRSIDSYGGALQRVILGYKYGRLRRLAKPLGELLFSVPRPSWSWQEISAIVPVPLHRERFLERGFDQVLLLALALKRVVYRNLRVVLPVERNLLVAARTHPPQVGSDRAARLHNLQGAFAPGQAAGKFQARQIVLVDDVLTTGATAAACCTVLKSIIPQTQLHVLTVARTPFRR